MSRLCLALTAVLAALALSGCTDDGPAEPVAAPPRTSAATTTAPPASPLPAPEALAAVPTLFGQRGNPVLLAREMFPAVSLLSGDRGARRLLDEAGERVIEVAFEDPAIAIDVDTPEALRALRG